jgi:large subunit ribosomal protein L24
MVAKQRLKNIRTGDRVLVIAGNERGRSGEVLAIHGDRVVVQGLNVRKRHFKKTQQHQRGHIAELEQPIHRSNVVICDKENRPLRLKVQVTDEGERQLVYQKGDEQVVYRTLKKKNP